MLDEADGADAADWLEGDSASSWRLDGLDDGLDLDELEDIDADLDRDEDERESVVDDERLDVVDDINYYGIKVKDTK